MKQKLVTILAFIGAAALLAGAFLMWTRRPWRTVVTVNDHQLSARELDQRAQGLLKDQQKREHLMVPESLMKDALKHFRLEAAQKWVIKEVMLDEALARRIAATPADEKDGLARMTQQLRAVNLTPEEFFTRGPLPEATLRQEFREGILINKLLTKEVRDKIVVTPKEIDARLAELTRLSLAMTKPGEKPPRPVNRKLAVDSLRNERFEQGFRDLFLALRAKATVKAPEFPELEALPRAR